MAEFGIRWSEFDRNNRLVGKEKIFETEKARDSYVRKLRNKNNFSNIDAYLDDDN